MKYHFERPTITRKDLTEQLQRVRELLSTRAKAEEPLWIETIPNDSPEWADTVGPDEYAEKLVKGT